MDVSIDPVGRPFDAVLSVPASKSLVQRALVLGALCATPPRIVVGTEAPGDDVRRVEAACAALGGWSGAFLGTGRESLRLDLGRGATGLRLAIALATLRRDGARTLVTGHATLRRRPHQPLIRALTRLGARVRRRSSGSVRVRGGRWGGQVVVEGTRSTQYASALLLAAPRSEGLVLRVSGERVSRPYLDMTLSMLERFGVAVAGSPEEGLRVEPCAPAAGRIEIEPDASAAAAWWTAAALTGGRVRVPGLGRGTQQADGKMLEVLEAAGAKVETTADGTVVVEGREPLGAPGRVDLRDAPDLLPLVGVLAAASEGTTTVVGVAHARWKESDRIATVARGLAAVGARVQTRPDGLEIRGGPLHGARIDVVGDHRIAFAFGVLGLRVPRMVLAGGEAAMKSHPRFLADLAALAAPPA